MNFFLTISFIQEWHEREKGGKQEMTSSSHNFDQWGINIRTIVEMKTQNANK